MSLRERKIVYTDEGVKDVSNVDCTKAFSKVIDQIECDFQKKNYFLGDDLD